MFSLIGRNTNKCTNELVQHRVTLDRPEPQKRQKLAESGLAAYGNRNVETDTRSAELRGIHQRNRITGAKSF